MKNATYLLLLACIIATGCQPTLFAEFEDIPVVTCFLDAGASPVLTVAKLTAFRDDAVYSDADVNTLSITITDETANEPYQMQPAGDGRYENPQMTVETGHTYRLDFTYNGKPVTATATVPDAPQDVQFSTEAVGVMNFRPGEPLPNLEDIPDFDRQIEITWNNDDRNFYIVEGFTTSTEIIEGMMLNPNQSSGSEPSKNFKLDYTQSNYATLSTMQFRYLGDYEVSLIRIQPEYVLMSQGTTTNTSANIVDVKGNIDGGYGLFTGISRVSKTVNVYAVEF